MANPIVPVGPALILSPSLARHFHTRGHSRSPSRSPTRARFTDDLLDNLSAEATLEALNSKNATPALKASVEAASPTQRAFGQRAAAAARNIQKWVEELAGWPWPNGGGSLGFESPKGTKKDDLARGANEEHAISTDKALQDKYYWGSLPAIDVLSYEARLDEIALDMEDLDVEELKTRVLEHYTLPKSRPSSSQGPNTSQALPPPFESYTKVEDFTAVVTHIVLRALPNLDKLHRLMNVWSVRLAVLRDIQPLMSSMNDVELALRSGWLALSKDTQAQQATPQGLESLPEAPLTRDTFDVMRLSLQTKVTKLGQKVDFLLDSLAGLQDTMPEDWIDRMEAIEQDYGDWVVYGDRRVRHGEWAAQRAGKRRSRALKADVLSESVYTESSGASADSIDQTIGIEEQPNVTKPEQATTALEAADSVSDDDVFEDEDSQFHAADVSVIKPVNSKRTSMAFYAEDGQKGPVLDSDKAAAGSHHRTTASPSSESISEARLVLKMPSEKALSSTEHVNTSPKPMSTYEALNGSQNEDLEETNFATSYADQIEEIVRGNSVLKARLAVLDVKSQASPKMANPGIPSPKFTALSADHDQLDGSSRATDMLQFDDLEMVDVSGASPERPLTPKRVAPSTILSHDYLGAPPNLPSAIAQEQKQGPMAEDHVGTLSSDKSLETSIPSDSITNAAEAQQSSDKQAASPSTPGVDPLIFAQPTTPTTPSTSSTSSVHRALKSPSNQSKPGQVLEDGGTPRSPSKMKRFGSGFANGLRLSFAKKTPARENTVDPFYSNESVASLATPENQTSKSVSLSSPEKVRREASSTMIHDANFRATSSPDLAQEIASRSSEALSATETSKALAILRAPGQFADSSNTSSTTRTPNIGESNHAHRDSFSSSVSGYASSPEISVAKPGEYFRPVLSPIKSPRGPMTHARASTPFEDIVEDPVESATGPVTWRRNSDAEVFIFDADDASSSQHTSTSNPATPTSAHDRAHKRLPDGASQGEPLREIHGRGPEPEDVASKGVQEPDFDVSPLNEENETDMPSGIEASIYDDTDETIYNPLGISSEVPAAVAGTVSSYNSNTPARVFVTDDDQHHSTPDIDESHLSFPDYDDNSPSIGRVRLHGDDYDLSPPDSPTLPPRRAMRPSEIQYDIESLTPAAPQTPLLEPVLEEAPIFANVSLTAAPVTTTLSKTTDSQLQQQISEILSHLPTRITLATSTTTSPIQVKKRNISHSSNFRSFSSRATTPTPSFTLAPAPSTAKTPRQRPTPSNPEIKLYHLSRSTGEAPIKLFVRLVGEHGERVMVRVGGGWADLGEYLKEYASHHGRRSSDARGGKVEIQDLPGRNISGASMSGAYSGGRVSRQGGRSSPISRPGSSMDMSSRASGGSLGITKTRGGTGDEGSYGTPPSGFARSAISPGTFTSSPPSGQRSSSAMSWRDESYGSRRPETELGLAGPKGRKSDISKEKMEWVESMKEKVRVASVEKEKRREMEEEFGRLGKVGGTKRLFKKSTG